MVSQLVKMSNKYGSNEEYVLAGGGNTSCKDDAFLFVKGSGTSLSDITQDGFVKMERAKLDMVFKKEYVDNTVTREAEVLKDLLYAKVDVNEPKRPSVEVLLHNLFAYTFVMHTHPALINGLTCGVDGKALTEELFGDKAIWVDLIEPGYLLSVAVNKAMLDYTAKTGKDADIIFLQNHGIFVAGNSEKEIDDKYNLVVETLITRIKSNPDFSEVEFDKERAALIAPAIRMICDGIVTFRTNKQTVDYLKDSDSFAPISSVYSPDHMVYYKKKPLFIAYAEGIAEQYKLIEDGIKSFENENGFKPQIIAVQGLGYYSIAKNKKSADISALLFKDTMKIAFYTQFFGGPLFMSDYMISFIENWEAESYRQGVSAGATGRKRVEGKISIITGSAQGFGLGLAEEMAKEGAYVILSDMNYDLAKENADRLESEFGAGMAYANFVNVAEEDSVKNMIYDVVLGYGGLDVFVNNAGVLRAGGLEEMDINSFEFVTKVNYTAYFICAKFASRIMKIQRRFKLDYMADIVQINSKSGLSGSNRNFAYAGGKFGGIGLTQSFAMELIEDGIKVNAICPGNLMSGPLWMDPEKGLFVQYLRTGKVPGAKNIDDVRKFYEDKVPMKRGCEIIDVARALFYVIDQDYETGQAVPVTGGQNMLK